MGGYPAGVLSKPTRAARFEVPPKVEYSLTELGRSLNEALIPLDVWGSDHLTELEASRVR
ncbi:winged helix-turn-helix transcriptional regulator [Kribbella sp. NPDC055110]